MDRSFQFDFMSIFIQSSTLLAPILLPEFCTLTMKKKTTTASDDFLYLFFFSVCVFMFCSHVWTSSGILYILSSSSWWFFLVVVVVIDVHYNPHCAYVVHPHSFRINSISLFYSSLFVYLFENFDFSISLSRSFSPFSIFV